MAVNKTSLSAGEIIRDLLTNDAEVKARSNKVFPVVSDNAKLPYIVYRRVALGNTPVKGKAGADEVSIEVICYTEKYGEGVELAEAVRGALDGVKAKQGDFVMRSCYLTESEEAWQDDAYLQQLVFTIKI